MRVAVLLAAGGSRRFGRTNKLLARFRRDTVLDRAADALAAAPAQRLIAITGADAPKIERALRRKLGTRVRILRNRRWRDGMGSSLRLAAEALAPSERWAFLFLADTPLVRPGEGHRLLRALRPGTKAVRLAAGDRPGHPALIHRSLLDQLAPGDRGLGGVLARSAAVVTIRTDIQASLDVDTPALLGRARLLRRHGER